ncbi:cathepsin propeptide inhibitor domain I29 [Nitzschia inconspicua]|uniref:Cathepsin propeptide inhibitor domain I29 n=1 Tax=Nitzschia inconspicua TaxID=303405 RepID=A0A9K3Q6D4_9STRA|nr:cathepsin propeptide inhibitor domain I29 [Nitzschia inconspicua]
MKFAALPPKTPKRWSLVSAIFASLILPTAEGYISPAPHGGWDPNKHNPRTQKNPPCSDNASMPTFIEPPTNVQVEDIFREEYHDWAKRYGKKVDMNDAERFENFKVNFLLQMQHNKKTGIFYLLNEYGDLTVQEYNQLMNKGRNVNTDTATKNNNASKPTNGDSQSSWTPSKDRDDKISGVDVVEALAKTAQEYQNYLSRKSASANRRRDRERNTSPSDPAVTNPKPTSPKGGDDGEYLVHQELMEDLEAQHQQFMDGITSQPKVVATSKQDDTTSTKPKKESNGYAVMAELVIDPPSIKDCGSEDAPGPEHPTTPRVKPPPKVQAMGTNQSYEEKDAPRKRPGTLESKYFQTVKGTPSNRSFFSGIGTQFVGVSSNKRLVRWEPGMDG